MTWLELKIQIAQLTPEQLLHDVALFDTAENDFFPVTGYSVTTEDDILHQDHAYLLY